MLGQWCAKLHTLRCRKEFHFGIPRLLADPYELRVRKSKPLRQRRGDGLTATPFLIGTNLSKNHQAGWLSASATGRCTLDHCRLRIAPRNLLQPNLDLTSCPSATMFHFLLRHLHDRKHLQITRLNFITAFRNVCMPD